MATVPKPPLIKYRLDFGKALGGSMAPAAVTPVVNYFMKEIITKMLVWPQRLVIPILQVRRLRCQAVLRMQRQHAHAPCACGAGSACPGARAESCEENPGAADGWSE